MSQRELPLLVEIIGPAGAGKSTLLGALGRQRPALSLFADRLRMGERKNLPFYIGSGLAALPTLLRPSGQGRWYTKEEISRILYLVGMPRHFQERHGHSPITVVDQGPIFELTQLCAYGPGRLNDPALNRWWTSIFQRWAPMLPLVVWLDAPDAVLIPRIQGREQAHVIKGFTAEEAKTMLAHYRTSFKAVMTTLQHYAAIEVLAFATDCMSTEQIAEQLVQRIEHLVDCNNAKKAL
jgi:hypothetical protein